MIYKNNTIKKGYQAILAISKYKCNLSYIKSWWDIDIFHLVLYFVLKFVLGANIFIEINHASKIVP